MRRPQGATPTVRDGATKAIADADQPRDVETTRCLLPPIGAATPGRGGTAVGLGRAESRRGPHATGDRDGLWRGDHEPDRRAREARPTQRTSHTVDRTRTAQSESHVVTRWFEGPL